MNPVILLTGWGEGMHGGNDRLTDMDAVVGKPPRLGELRELLDRFANRP